MMKEMFKFTSQPHFENPSLIIGWSRDSGKLSPGVIDYLNQNIEGRSFCEIELAPKGLAGFFPLAGVAVENDVAQFPESQFYYSQKHQPLRGQLVIFKSSEPQSEVYRFLNAILDVAIHYCKVKQLYTVNGVVSRIAHTDPRRILAVFNQPEIKKELRSYGLTDMTWQGKPAISTYLLWLAKRRNIAGASLWTEVPFYLAALEDFQSIRTTISFLDQRLSLGADLRPLDRQISEQNEKLDELRREDPEISKCIGSLESGLSLSEQEQMEVIKGVSDFFGRKDSGNS